VQVPVKLAPTLRPGTLEWLVPGLREEQVNVLLHALPKTLRRALMPLAPKAKAVAAALPAGPEPLPEALSRCFRQQYGVIIPTAAWNLEALPPYLRPWIEIVAKDKRVLAAGRDLSTLQAQLKKAEVPLEMVAWRRAAQRWERFGVTGWTFGDLPERIEVAEVKGMPFYAYPGLYLEEREVSVRLFLKPRDAELASAAGFDRLCELALPRELGWLQKDLRSLAPLAMLYVTLGPAEELMTTAYAHLRRYLFECDPLFPLRAARFAEVIARAQSRLPGLAARLVAHVKAVLELRQEILVLRHPYPGMLNDLNRLVPRQFLTVTRFERLAHLPRYLKALRVRAERAALNPVKDREKARRVQPYLEALEALRGARPPDRQTQQALEDFCWGLEEFKVSCFAQELGTAQPVSPHRLDQQLEGLRSLLAGAGAAPRPAP